MFKELTNQFRLTFSLRTDGPLLIRSGNETGLDPTRPDMEFVRTGGQVYIPGSSLKGAFRFWCERLLRAAEPAEGSYACMVLDMNRSCAKRHGLERVSSAAARYSQSCLACRLFGNTALRGRVEFLDGRAVSGTVRTSQRNHVAINRITGGAQGSALFSPEVVEDGTFRCQFTLTNYALWQASILLQALQDLDDGYLTIGGGSAKGYGRLKIVQNSDDAQLLMKAEWRDYRQSAPQGWQGRAADDRVPCELSFVRGVGWTAEWHGLDTWPRLRAALPHWEQLLAADKVEG